MIVIRLFLVFLKVGLFTIGSGYSMLVLAQRYVVESYHWLTVQEFTDLVAMQIQVSNATVFQKPHAVLKILKFSAAGHLTYLVSV